VEEEGLVKGNRMEGKGEDGEDNKTGKNKREEESVEGEEKKRKGYDHLPVLFGGNPQGLLQLKRVL
jgi:hypothetical protein